ncbi:MAG: pentapeptide repeat-containing protein [Gemmobacter sp.]
MRDRSDIYFLVGALALAAGVPSAVYAIYFLADSIELVATIMLLALLIVCIAGVLIARYRDKILQIIFKASKQLAEDIKVPTNEAINGLLDGNSVKARENAVILVELIAARYTWMQTRRWIATVATGLLVGFAGLVGSALLKQQNDLITAQNRFFQQEIEQQGLQLALQQNVANQTVRSDAIRVIYGPEFSATPRVRAEAVRSLVAVERTRIGEGTNTLPTDYVNLHDADLTGAWLESADLVKVSFRGANVSRANFNSTDLNEAFFRFVEMKGATFIGSMADGVLISFSDAESAVFSGASMEGASVNQVNLKGALLNDVSVAGATFYKVNLEGADLSGMKNWSAIADISETNIANLRAAPDGFREWALENGAIDVPGALASLWTDAMREKRREESSE